MTREPRRWAIEASRNHGAEQHMGRRLGRKRRKVTLPEGPYVERVHDRKATDLLRNAQVAPIDVDDPFEPGTKITVLRSTRRDPLAWMHAHGQVSDAQYHAGRDWQRDWEAAERGPVAIDPSKEFVDGGLTPEPITERQRKAAMRLKGVAAVVQQQDERRILQAFLIEGLSIEQVALRVLGRFGAGYTRRMGERIGGILDTLAVFYGYAMKEARA